MTRKMIDVGICTHGISNQSTMNHSPNYEDLVKHGYRYYIDQCKEKLAAHNVDDVYDMEQRIAWQAMIITMEAIISFCSPLCGYGRKHGSTVPRRDAES